MTPLPGQNERRAVDGSRLDPPASRIEEFALDPSLAHRLDREGLLHHRANGVLSVGEEDGCGGVKTGLHPVAFLDSDTESELLHDRTSANTHANSMYAFQSSKENSLTGSCQA